jgi:hypothetical protein
VTKGAPLGVLEGEGVGEAERASPCVALGVFEGVAEGVGVAEALACRARKLPGSGTTRHTLVRLPPGPPKSLTQGVRHWQPLVETGQVGQ